MKASKSIHRADVQRPAFLGSLDLVMAAGGAGDHEEGEPHVDLPVTPVEPAPRPVEPAPRPVETKPRPVETKPQVQPPAQSRWGQYVVAYPSYYYMVGC